MRVAIAVIVVMQAVIAENVRDAAITNWSLLAIFLCAWKATSVLEEIREKVKRP